ncbi:type II secretion system F family protein [Glaciecola sp. KUL10]|uniref:type II secretion system F family protein n=1 Tax=Glaciecola sp. (strain KUL10) TaxID=2161813 RepID=UPI000D78576F|nr:type II secretion system F family protein [Glaciecola sp. KUL10]GBL04175.1 type II secretion system protein [Glaciecola sp. KUL10]
MKFRYQGIHKGTQQKTQGLIEASSKAEVLSKLSQEIELFDVQREQIHQKAVKKLKLKDLLVPLQELATLSESGVSLIDSLAAIAENSEYQDLSRGFHELVVAIESGSRFSDAIERSKMPFPEYAAQLIKAGELSGQLAASLRSIADQMAYEIGVANDIRSALAYPIILVLSGLSAMLIIFFAVVPKFSHLLDAEQELPTLAVIVLSAGKAVNDSPFVILFALSLILIGIVALIQNKTLRAKALEISLSMPVVGQWLAEQDAAKWSSLCAAMLKAKVGLVPALQLAANACTFQTRKRRAEEMVKQIESGDAFDESLKKANLVSSTSLNLISVGDKTGNLAKMLEAVANLHDESCKRKMKQVLTLMEPIAILVVGVLIGTMVLGIVLAITASTDIAI